jgi:hypothetical protein
MRGRLVVCVAIGIAVLAMSARAASAEIIDRILAVVAGQIITKSDVDAAVRFGLVDASAGEPLQAVIDRVLMLGEVRRVVPAEPSQASIDARLTAIRARFASPTALRDALTVAGIDESVLRIYAEDDVTLAAYLDERFSAAAQPTDQEILQAGEGNRQKLADERRRTLVTGWIAELRRRSEIEILP